MQVVASYNVRKLATTPSFALTQTTLDVDKRVVQVRTCVTYFGSAPTGMALIEAQLLSGYEVNKLEMDKLGTEQLPDLRMVDIKSGDKVVFYLNSLHPSKELCIYWNMYKAHDVTELKPVTVRVYDYYNSQLDASIIYQPPKVRSDSVTLSRRRYLTDHY